MNEPAMATATAPTTTITRASMRTKWYKMKKVDEVEEEEEGTSSLADEDYTVDWSLR